MSEKQTESKKQGGGFSRLFLLLGILVAVLAVLFHRSFDPNQIIFSNDGPLGILAAENFRFPTGMTGQWLDLNWLGIIYPSLSFGFTTLGLSAFSPEVFLRVYTPMGMLIVGLSVWVFFRQLGFGPFVCVLGGLAGGLNSHCLSNGCWGLTPMNLAGASLFLAAAAIVSPAIRQTWIKAALAGMAIGMAVIEGADVGAILSIYFGIFVLFYVLSQQGGLGNRVLKAFWVPALVVGFAMWIAFHTVINLVATQVTGVVGTGQSKEQRDSRWAECTTWSLPKLETLRLIIPGVFGYRMQEYIDGDDRSSAYWGSVAQDPRIPLIDSLESRDSQARRKAAEALGLAPEAVDALTASDPGPRTQIVESLRQQEGSMMQRHSGNGEYVGILVAILALFGVSNAFRGKKSPFSTNERRMVFFWAAVALVSLLLAFGRHGFLYHYLFQLPYVSTIRNPIKFLFPVHIALIVLSGYGLEVLNRQYLQKASTRVGSLSQHLKLWWSRVTGFEKKWVIITLLAFGIAFLATLVLLSSKAELELYLQHHGIGTALAPQITSFFYSELFLFLLFLAASLFGVTCVLSGSWNGNRARWAWIFLGAIMVSDLSHSDLPWIKYYDFDKRYVTNPVIEYLRDKPYEHRVSAELMPKSHMALAKDNNLFSAYYDMLQNQIPYFNIQSLDIIQMPRTAEFDENYINTFRPKKAEDLYLVERLWQLTNTRYLLGAKDNQFGLLRPEGGYQSRVKFNVQYKAWVLQPTPRPEDLTFVESEQGPFELFEFTNALPRAKLYANWQTPTNDRAILDRLSSREFKPEKTVLIAPSTPVAKSPASADADPGSVAITSYHPKDIVLSATAKTASVLLLNDRYAPDWKVWVDGKPTDVLRCNYIMRGVYLEPGEHQIEFRFKPVMTSFYISMGAWVAGILLAGYAFVTNRKRPGVQKGVKISSGATA